MSVTPAQSTYLTFVAGLNTEGGYFTQPPNTWRDGDNMFPQIDGSLHKRRALDFEASYVQSTDTFTSTQADTNAFSCSTWINVAGVAGRTFYVVQIGDKVWFYDNTSSTVSTQLRTFSIDLSAYRVAANTSIAGSNEIQTSSADGGLLIVADDITPLHIAYDAGTDTITVTPLTLLIRDFEGVEDGMSVDTKPTTLSNEHKYNLLNQGWTNTQIDAYKTAKGVFPSNAQAWIYGKDSNGDFDSNVLDKLDFGTSKAPRGRYILDVFNQDRATIAASTTVTGESGTSGWTSTWYNATTGITSYWYNSEGWATAQASSVDGLPTFVENSRPTTVAFFGGRAWYSGINSSRIGSYLLFSVIANRPEEYGQCHQVADPTSEVLSDLVETDGGVIPIKDAQNIHKLVPMFDGIIIFADNGVWQVVGSSQGGFTATGYTVYRVSNIGSVGASSIVEIDNSIMYWSNGGIYKVMQDPQTGIIMSSPMTDLNIKSYYIDIPSLGKRLAKGSYNNATKQVTWTYNNNLTVSGTQMYTKNKLLMLDMRLGAFYTASISSVSGTTPLMVSHFVTDTTSAVDTAYYVVDSSLQQVIDSSSDNVTSAVTDTQSYTAVEKFLTIVPSGTNYKVTFSDFYTTNNAPAKFRDWYTYDNAGASYTSYITTGYDISQAGPAFKKYPTYCTVYMNRTETGFDGSFNAINESSCTLQTKWDFTDNTSAGKWGDPQEVYRHLRQYIPDDVSGYNDGFPLVITKNKIRGSGKAVQFKFTADPDKDLQLVGWQVILINLGNV